MTSGVYEILTTVNGKRYIGSSARIEQRWKFHYSLLKRGVHHSPALQNAWNKYGEPSFEFRIIYPCSEAQLLFQEQRCLHGFLPEYNICKVAGSVLGIKRPPEFGAAQSKRQTGQKKSLDARANMRAAKLGKKQTPEHIAKRAASMKGNKNFVNYVRRPEDDQNRRTNHKLQFRGETLCIAEWARRLGIKPRAIQMRLVQGWSTEQALGTPTLVRGRWSKKGKYGQHKDFQ